MKPDTVWGFVTEIVVDPQFHLQCALSGVFATLLYCAFGYFIAGKYGRVVRGLGSFLRCPQPPSPPTRDRPPAKAALPPSPSPFAGGAP
jgi:hypothetical protein